MRGGSVPKWDSRATPPETVIGVTEPARFYSGAIRRRITGPALSIIQPQSDVEEALHRMLPGFRHVAIDGAGHWIHLAAPDVASKFYPAMSRVRSVVAASAAKVEKVAGPEPPDQRHMIGSEPHTTAQSVTMKLISMTVVAMAAKNGQIELAGEKSRASGIAAATVLMTSARRS